MHNFRVELFKGSFFSFFRKAELDDEQQCNLTTVYQMNVYFGSNLFMNGTLNFK